MNILHSPTNIGGQLSILAKAQRRLGHRSDVMVFTKGYLKYECDYNLEINLEEPIERKNKRVMDFFKYAIETYEVFHFYFGRSLLPHYQDLPILKSLGKKIFFTYVGHDAHQMSRYMRYPINMCRECANPCTEEHEERIRKNIEKVSKYANAMFSGGIEAECVPGALTYVHRLPIDLEEWPYVGSKKRNRIIRIVHAPTNRAIKGTRYVIDAVEQLKRKNYPVELILVERMSNEEAKTLYMEADVIVDQLLIGWYGGLAVECMALGKPVLAYIREDVKEKASYAKDLPIVSTHPFNLIDNLKVLIENQTLREEIGRRSREYVERVHDSMKIARLLCDLYERM